MPEVLIFDQNGVPQKIEKSELLTKIIKDQLRWVNSIGDEDIKSILPDIIDKSKSFTDDLIEEQRPRIQQYQTLEENEESFSVVVFSFPTEDIFDLDNFQLQISFVLIRNHLYSTSSKDDPKFSKIMEKVLKRKKSYTVTSLFGYIVSELVEMSIDAISKVEIHIDNLEREQLKGRLNKNWLVSLLNLKGRLFDASRLIKANLENIDEIITAKVPELNVEEISEHLEDRGLFLLDFIEQLREELINMINLHLAISSNIMNRQFYWLTIIGSLLIIPTVIASIFGMNVLLPVGDFWIIMIIMIILTGLAAIIVKYFLPKPLIA